MMSVRYSVTFVVYEIAVLCKLSIVLVRILLQFFWPVSKIFRRTERNPVSIS